MKLFFAGSVFILLSLGVLLLFVTSNHLKELKARGELILCLKETKGELHQFVTLMEKTNKAIKYIDMAKYLVFIPGLQTAGLSSQRAKELIKNFQNLILIRYLAKLGLLKKRCPLNYQAFMTPYQLGGLGFRRHFNGTAMWRKKWRTQLIGRYEIIQIQIKERDPTLKYHYSIRKGNALSLLPSLLGSSHSYLGSTFL